MLKIALVTPMLPVPHDQTRGRYIHETARALARIARVRVYFMQLRYRRIPGLVPRSFISGEVDTGYRLDGLDVETFSYRAITGVSRMVNGYVASRALTPRVRAFAPDVVLAYWVYPDGNAALRTARRIGVPCVVGALGSDIHVRSGITEHLTRSTIAQADALLTVSENMRQTAIARFGARPDKVHTIVNGFDTRVFHPRDQTAMRRKFGLEPGIRLILYVGRFVEAKGIRELIAAFQSIAANDPSARLAMVGDGVMRDDLSRIVAERGLADKVLLPGGMEPEAVAEWIGASDVLTLPSWSEGYPNVLVEALACGRPVVATDVGGTREIVSVSNGIMIPARDAGALASALELALAQDWDHAGIAVRMRRSWDDVARETLGACQDVCDARAGGAATN